MEATQENIADGPTPWDSVDPLIEVCTVNPTPNTEHRTPNAEPQAGPISGGAFTIPLICIGVAIIACCLLIPAADENRRLAYEKLRLEADLEQLQKQVATNDAFLDRIANDPTLAERLARRQMKMVPQGTAVLELKNHKPTGDMSPYSLVTVPPPAPMPPYRPIGGFISNAVRHPKSQLYLIGGGMMMIACGLVMSHSSDPAKAQAEDASELADADIS